MVRAFVALMRPKHYIKNGLIFVPLIFSGRLFADHNLVTAAVAALAFSTAASFVYIINDLQDIEKDRQHPKKKLRPLAAGTVSVGQAITLAALLAAITAALGYIASLSVTAWLILLAYVAINIAYSSGLKNIPIVDVAILAAGFMLRVLYGGAVVDVEVSRWLYLTILAGAFYLGLGKRRGELAMNGSKSRRVNELYTYSFLDKNMYLCSALALVFYSLWATDPARSTASLFWTIPLVIVLFMTYNLDIEKDGSMGDPVDVLLDNKALVVFALAYIGLTTYLLYV